MSPGTHIPDRPSSRPPAPEGFPSRYVPIARLEHAGVPGTDREAWVAFDRQATEVRYVEIRTMPAAEDVWLEAIRRGRTVSGIGLRPLREVCAKGSRAYLVRAWVPGITLWDVLESAILNPLIQGALVWRTARALASLHATGLVHGDLDPAQLVLTPEGELVLVGWLAALTGDAVPGPPPAAVIPRYRAPEALAEDPPTPRGDIYSLALTVCHLFMGRPLVPAASVSGYAQAQETLTRALSQRSRFDPSIPAALDVMLHSMLSPEPASRPPLSEVLAALERTLSPRARGEAATPTLQQLAIQVAPGIRERSLRRFRTHAEAGRDRSAAAALARAAELGPIHLDTQRRAFEEGVLECLWRSFVEEGVEAASLLDLARACLGSGAEGLARLVIARAGQLTGDSPATARGLPTPEAKKAGLVDSEALCRHLHEVPGDTLASYELALWTDGFTCPAGTGAHLARARLVEQHRLWDAAALARADAVRSGEAAASELHRVSAEATEQAPRQEPAADDAPPTAAVMEAAAAPTVPAPVAEAPADDELLEAPPPMAEEEPAPLPDVSATDRTVIAPPPVAAAEGVPAPLEEAPEEPEGRKLRVTTWYRTMQASELASVLSRLVTEQAPPTEADPLYPEPVELPPQDSLAEGRGLVEQGRRKLEAWDLTGAARDLREALEGAPLRRETLYASVVETVRELIWRTLARIGADEERAAACRQILVLVRDLELPLLAEACEHFLVRWLAPEDRRRKLEELIGEAPDSLAFLDAATREAERTGDPADIAACLVRQSRALLDFGELTAASRLVMRAKALSDIDAEAVSEAMREAFDAGEQLAETAQTFKQLEAALPDLDGDRERLLRLREFLAAHPDYVPALVATAETYRRTGEVHLSNRLTMRLARRALARGSLGEARRHLCAVLEIEPGREEALLYLAALSPPPPAPEGTPRMVKLQLLEREGLYAAELALAQSSLTGGEEDVPMLEALIRASRELGEDPSRYLIGMGEFLLARDEVEAARRSFDAALASGARRIDTVRALLDIPDIDRVYPEGPPGATAPPPIEG